MSEKNLWNRVRPNVLPYGDFIRIECSLPGVPDVNFSLHSGVDFARGVEGWIELKHGKKPARPSTQVFKSQRGLDTEQVTWLVWRIKNGGRAFIFVQIDKDVILLDGMLAPQFNSLTFDQMVENSLWHRTGGVKKHDWAEFVAALKH